MNKVKQIINNVSTTLGLNEVFEDTYDFYCSICQSCGETECCPPTICTQEEGCKYPKTNLIDLKYNYTSYRRLLEYIYSRECYPEILKELDKIQDEEYDKWYPEKALIDNL